MGLRRRLAYIYPHTPPLYCTLNSSMHRIASPRFLHHSKSLLRLMCHSERLATNF
ncbi:hypothetical protein P692DRAFT_20897106 [Suillus brevipes Sb2]|nr:hypothetical protein P692DRAFT_20897106 [Suillus brevipes Sb2]